MSIPMPDGGEPGHLYKFGTVLGVFIMVTSLYSASIVASNDELRVREYGIPRFNEEVRAEVREQWLHYHAQALRNAEVAFNFLVVAACLGLVVAVAGAWGWYFKVQRFEDERRRLENEKLRQDTKPSGSVIPAG